MAKRKDPKIGTGKKPKGSGRRLYTDENPKDTVSIKFATPADARATVSKVKKINKPFARKIQILTVGEQRAKVMGKTQVVSIFKKGKESLRKAKKVGQHLKTQKLAKYAQRARLGQSAPLIHTQAHMQILPHQSIAKTLTMPKSPRVAKERAGNG